MLLPLYSFDVYVSEDYAKYVLDAELHPDTFETWAANDRKACAFISTSIDEEDFADTTFISAEEDAASYWLYLEKQYQKEGAVNQAFLLRDAMGMHAQAGDSLTTGIDKLFLIWIAKRTSKEPGGSLDSMRQGIRMRAGA